MRNYGYFFLDVIALVMSLINQFLAKFFKSLEVAVAFFHFLVQQTMSGENGIGIVQIFAQFGITHPSKEFVGPIVQFTESGVVVQKLFVLVKLTIPILDHGIETVNSSKEFSTFGNNVIDSIWIFGYQGIRIFVNSNNLKIG